MNEEEKKAIERLEEQLNFWRKQNIKNSDCEIILNLITKLQKENEELKKHDYRNIKIDEENKIESPSFTKEQLSLMNLGIALYIGIPKLLEDEEKKILKLAKEKGETRCI